MCWSYEVALTFSVLEIAVLLYIYFRNSYFDRYNALFHIPVVGQELLQALLWPNVNGTEGAKCNSSNRRLSFLITFVVIGLVPYVALLQGITVFLLDVQRDAETRRQIAKGVCKEGHELTKKKVEAVMYYCSVCKEEDLPLQSSVWRCEECDFDACHACVQDPNNHRSTVFRKQSSWFGRLIYSNLGMMFAPLLLGSQISLWSPNVTHRRRTQILLSAVAGIIFWIGSCLFMGKRIFGDWLDGSIFEGPRCTTKGPFGHQVWPMLVYPGRYWIKLVTAGLYMYIGGCFHFMPKPSYLPKSLQLLAQITVILYFVIGDEWGSVWCWLASCLCFIYLFEPSLFQRSHVFDPEFYNNPPSKKSSVGAGFYMALGHLEASMLPYGFNKGIAEEIKEVAYSLHTSSALTIPMQTTM